MLDVANSLIDVNFLIDTLEILHTFNKFEIDTINAINDTVFEMSTTDTEEHHSIFYFYNEGMNKLWELLYFIIPSPVNDDRIDTIVCEYLDDKDRDAKKTAERILTCCNENFDIIKAEIDGATAE